MANCFWNREQASPSGAAGAGRIRLKREIRVFPALAPVYTKIIKRYDADAGIGESVGFMERSGSGTE